MILVALLRLVAEASEALENAVDLIVPDSWLTILRSTLHGFGTPLIEAFLWHFTQGTREAIAVTVDILFSMWVARLTIRGVRRIRSWLP